VTLFLDVLRSLAFNYTLWSVCPVSKYWCEINSQILRLASKFFTLGHYSVILYFLVGAVIGGLYWEIKNNQKNIVSKRYWLRGGIIVMILFAVPSILTVVPWGFQSFQNYIWQMPFLVIFAPFIFIFYVAFGLSGGNMMGHNSDNFYIMMPIVLLGLYFLIGAVTGGLYGKIKNKYFVPKNDIV